MEKKIKINKSLAWVIITGVANDLTCEEFLSLVKSNPNEIKIRRFDGVNLLLQYAEGRNLMEFFFIMAVGLNLMNNAEEA